MIESHVFSWLSLQIQTYETNIAKDITEPGVDCFNQINTFKKHAIYPGAM